MNRIKFKSRVGGDGVLQLSVPLGASEAHHEVQVTVEPAATSNMTHEEWRQWVESMAGRIADPSFCRPEQGEYEAREAFN